MRYFRSTLLERHFVRSLNSIVKLQSHYWSYAVRPIIGLCLLLSLSAAEAAVPDGCPSTGVKVFLSANGTVALNGKVVEVSRLKSMLGDLVPKPTVVCYSREAPDAEPPSTMKPVLDAIISLQVPIGLYTDSTFTVRLKPN